MQEGGGIPLLGELSVVGIGIPRGPEDAMLMVQYQRIRRGYHRQQWLVEYTM